MTNASVVLLGLVLSFSAQANTFDFSKKLSKVPLVSMPAFDLAKAKQEDE
jgi:hypothetical protein